MWIKNRKLKEKWTKKVFCGEISETEMKTWRLVWVSDGFVARQKVLSFWNKNLVWPPVRLSSVNFSVIRNWQSKASVKLDSKLLRQALLLKLSLDVEVAAIKSGEKKLQEQMYQTLEGNEKGELSSSAKYLRWARWINVFMQTRRETLFCSRSSSLSKAEQKRNAKLGNVFLKLSWWKSSGLRVLHKYLIELFCLQLCQR